MAVPAAILAAAKGAKSLAGLNARLAKLQQLANAVKQFSELAAGKQAEQNVNGSQKWQSELSQEDSSLRQSMGDPVGMNVVDYGQYESLPTWYYELPSIKEVDKLDSDRY